MDANTPSRRPSYLARYKDCRPGWSGFGWGVNSPPIIGFRKRETRGPGAKGNRAPGALWLWDKYVNSPTDCRNCGGDGFSTEGGACRACQGSGTQ